MPACPVVMCEKTIARGRGLLWKSNDAQSSAGLKFGGLVGHASASTLFSWQAWPGLDDQARMPGSEPRELWSFATDVGRAWGY